ncbi:MAG: penicillin-binding protein 1A [Paracoccaceae bacterium]
MVRFFLSFLGTIFSLLTIGSVTAALFIGGVFWYYSRDLPSHEQLANYTPPTISRIYSGEGKIIDEFARERRLFVPAADIPDLVKYAFISAEDKHFYTHKGYDLFGMASAARDAAQGGRLRGASTITQQVMKNFLLSSDRSAERKIKELILAVRLEETLDKEKILELYLNEIDLGARSFGVAAAAQSYYNKTLAELRPEEAAYLAALPKKPYGLDPVDDYDEAVGRRNFVLKEMNENGYLSGADYDLARAAPLETVQNGDFESFRRALPPRDYFTDEIRRQLSRNFGEDEFFNGGLSIRATVDPELQGKAANALRERLETLDRGFGIWRGTRKVLEPAQLKDEATWRAALANVQVARDIDLENQWYPAVILEIKEGDARIGIESVENDADGHWIPAKDAQWARKRNSDGSLGRRAQGVGDLVAVGDVVHVRRMTADSDGSFIRWTLRQVPEVQGGFMAMDVNTGRVIAMQGGFSYQHSVFNRATQATRQPGSSFKPFVYASALDSGFTPATIVVDAPIEINTPQGVWRPKNASRQFYGPTPLRTGIEQSRNLMTIRLAEEVGMDTVASYAERFGVYENMQPFLANALGSEETTLFKMVTAYGMFANGGERLEPTLVDRVQDRWGKTVYRHDQRVCEECSEPQIAQDKAPTIVSNRARVMDAITAYQLTSMMQGVVQRGTAKGRINLPVPVAGKTGTTNDGKDAWFVGFTSNIVAGCYIGFDRPRAMPGASGGGFCGPVFNSFMQEATRKYGGGKFRVPPGGHFIKIDRFTGARLSDSASGPNVVAEYFRDGEEPVFGIAFDGGFAMGANLPLFSGEVNESGDKVRTSTGDVVIVPKKATLGGISAGGLY